MNKITQAKLSKIIQEILDVPVTDDISMDSVPNWDSLRHIQLLSKIEHAFSINIDFKDTLAMKDMRSIRKVIDKYYDAE